MLEPIRQYGHARCAIDFPETEIRRRHAEGQTATEIARGLGCKKGQVLRITSGETYKEVE